MAKITLQIDGQTHNFEVPAEGKTILEVANENGADIPFSCQSGVCCTCMARVKEGSIDMESNMALDEEEVAEGLVLLCQSHPTSEEVVLEFED